MPHFGGGEVRFGGKIAAAIGAAGGVAVAAGLPTVILIYGTNLGVPAQVTLIILAVLMGGVITAVSAVLGIVIPTSASGGGKMRGAFTINVGKGKGKGKTVRIGAGEMPDKDEDDDEDEGDSEDKDDED
jgi:hypothetical protein